MDNNSSQQSGYPNQQYQSVLNNQPEGSYIKSKINLKLIGFIVAGVLVVGLVIFLIYSLFFARNYQLTVEGQQIPASDLRQAYDYYKSQEDFNEQESISFIQNLYAENYILKKEYENQGNDLSSLLETVEENEENQVPASLMKVIDQNSKLKAALLPNLGIKQRSGEVFRVSVNGLTEEENSVLEPLILQKLDQYRAQLETGSSSAQIATAFQNDSQLQDQDSLLTAVLKFENMSPSRPIMPGEAFVESVYSTLPGETSSPFIVKLENMILYSFVYITDTTVGEYDSYQVWLYEKIGELEIESSF